MVGGLKSNFMQQFIWDKHGKGKDIFTDGSEFVGLYINNKKQGKGKYTWSDSSSYEGDFEDDKIQGILKSY